ncbi:MAG: (2Fe-2S)-binding protein [Candidatus Aminicenantes bacterium]|nr:(2Fe-2S)-binding protein [Candidatus Aminicenantes bacterium]
MKNPIRLKIDNRSVTVPEGSTILTAAAELSIPIPTLCYLDGHEHFTSCMICAVEETKSGRLLPACSQAVSEGLQIETASEKVKAARKDALDFLLSEHVGDCEAPCRRACPAHMDIPLMIRLIKEKRFADAIEVIKRDIALPAVLGRICPAPCEKVCRRKASDDPVSICYLKRFASDLDLTRDVPYRPEVKEKSGKKIAVVGAGPAGLAAAFYLLREGHECTVYDRNARPGGMLRYGITRENLPGSVLDAEIEQISRLGVEFRLEQALGSDVQLEELKKQYDAVVLTIGKVEPPLLENSGIELSSRGIVINKSTFATSVPGVFAGGNAAAESRLAIRALAHGKGIAYSVSSYLSSEGFSGPSSAGGAAPSLPRPFDSRLGKLRSGEIEEFSKEAAAYGRVVPRSGFSKDAQHPQPVNVIRKSGKKETFVLSTKVYEEYRKGYSEAEAVKEAARCFLCDCRKPDSCKLRRYAEEYGADQGRFKLTERRKFERFVQHELVIYEPGKCIKCGLCVQISKKAGEDFGLTFVNRGFEARVEAPFKEPLSRGLQKTAWECVAACPTGALAFREKLEGNKND